MLHVSLNEKLDELLGKYLINVLSISQPWGEKKTIEQKDKERRELHDKLVGELGITDREMVSECTEDAYSAYREFGELRKAKNAFYHKFNILSGQNILTPEQETEMDRLYDSLSGVDDAGKEIRKKIWVYSGTERKKYYENLHAKYMEELSKKTPDELFELLKQIPGKYKELYVKYGTRSHEWYVWCDLKNYDCMRGFRSAYYEMVPYYCLLNFYHDYRARVGKVEDRIWTWGQQSDESNINWAVTSIATFWTWFNGAEEYLDTPFDKIVGIFVSFKEGENNGSKNGKENSEPEQG